eukprot:835092-Prorocentrum_minimum.AAC.1
MAEPCFLAMRLLTPNCCVQRLVPGGATTTTQPARSPRARRLVQGGRAAPGAVQTHIRGIRAPLHSSSSHVLGMPSH